MTPQPNEIARQAAASAGEYSHIIGTGMLLKIERMDRPIPGMPAYSQKDDFNG
jgi:hypothetical protein